VKKISGSDDQIPDVINRQAQSEKKESEIKTQHAESKKFLEKQ
jgi:hypothetical protein